MEPSGLKAPAVMGCEHFAMAFSRCLESLSCQARLIREQGRHVHIMYDIHTLIVLTARVSLQKYKSPDHEV